MSSFADILRKSQQQAQQTQQAQQAQQSQQSEQPPQQESQQQYRKQQTSSRRDQIHHNSHNHRGRRGHRRDSDDDDDDDNDIDPEELGIAGPSGNWGGRGHHKQQYRDRPAYSTNTTPTTWAARLSNSSTPTSSAKVTRPPSQPVLQSSDPVTPTELTPEESQAIAEANEKALQVLLSYLPYYPIMLVLCGIPGSGKSTFARRLIASIPVDYRPYWISLNQDALGDRKTVIRHTEHALQTHLTTIIDRCNFNAEQRHPWIDLAREYHIPAVVAFVLPDHNNVSICADRAYKRGNSDGIHPGNPNWNQVCARMNDDYTNPSMDEGFSAIYQCRTSGDIDSFIDRIVHAYDVMPRPHSEPDTR